MGKLEDAITEAARLRAYLRSGGVGDPDLAEISQHFYTNSEGDLVYIPPNSVHPPVEAEAEVPPKPEGAGASASPAPSPSQQPPTGSNEAVTPAPVPPPSVGQQILKNAASSGVGVESKLDPSKMGISKFIANVDELVKQSKES